MAGEGLLAHAAATLDRQRIYIALIAKMRHLHGRSALCVLRSLLEHASKADVETWLPQVLPILVNVCAWVCRTQDCLIKI